MKIQEKVDGNDFILSLEGDFDETTSTIVESKFEQALTQDVENIFFNLNRVDYISSAGIRVLIIAYKKAKKFGKRVLIENMSSKVHGILDTVGILHLFEVSKGEENATEA